MADPLSVAASIIAVATLATKTASTISTLRQINQLPGRLHAICNEISDLEVVLRHVALALGDKKLSRSDDQTDALGGVLQQIEYKLEQLENILKRLTKTCIGNGRFFVRAKAWFVEKPRLQSLQEDIHTLKTNLNIMLGTAHTQDMSRIQIDLQSISLITSQAAEKYTKTDEVLHSTQQLIDQRVTNLENLLLEQFNQLRSNITSVMGPEQDRDSLLVNKPPPPPYENRIMRKADNQVLPNFTAGISFKTTHYSSYYCKRYCRCNCHSKQEARSSSLLSPIIGQLFVGYVGNPKVRQACDIAACRRNKTKTINIEYFFPLWFLARIVVLMLSYQRNSGPQFQLRTLRLVADSSQSISYVLNGNIEGLKHLFSQGLASPNDVSQGRSYSLLRWAVFCSQIDTCRFLADAGADLNELTHAHTATSSDRLWDYLLRGKLSKTEEGTVRRLLDSSDYVEDQQFPTVHKIVLQLSFKSLQEELNANPFAVFETDVEGRTALSWAAARGDEYSISMLLTRGADPNSMDKNGITPVYLAANEGRSVCARLLLEAGALPDPVSPPGIPVRSSPLLCAAGNRTPVFTMKVLLDFGANIEAKSPDGETPLCAVARTNTAAHGLFLMENNADLNATTHDGKTPLTTAIVYNNHEVLKLFLDFWARYETCPRLAGPKLLQIVADFADISTIQILSDCEHFQLHGDKQYATAVEASERLRVRANTSEELIAAFDEFVTLISEEKDVLKEAMLESGFLRRSTASSSSDEEVTFLDAVEKIDIR